MNDIVTLPAPAGELDRRTYIGGSDIAAIMGLSPWMTPLQCYERKVSAAPEVITPEKRKFFARRKRQEPVIAEMLMDTYGIEVTRLSLDEDQNRYIDGEHPFLAAEIDFEFLMSDAVRAAFPDRPQLHVIADGTVLNGEIKTVHPFKAKEWGEEGSEDVPIHYAAQVMHGLGVARRPAALVAALFGLDNLVAFPLIADPETIAAVREKAVAFWQNHILPRIPPDPINMDDMMRLFSRVNGKPVEADEATVELLDQLRSIRSNIAALDERKDELEFLIADYVRRQWGIQPDTPPEAIDNAIITAAGVPFATWKKQSRTSIDSKRLQKEQSEIAEKYSRTTWFRSLRFK